MGTELYRYYEELGERDKMIKVAHRLGNFYSQYENYVDAELSLFYYEIERSYVGDYLNIDSWEIRKSILFAHYNYAIVLLRCLKIRRYVRWTESATIWMDFGRNFYTMCSATGCAEVTADRI